MRCTAFKFGVLLILSIIVQSRVSSGQTVRAIGESCKTDVDCTGIADGFTTCHITSGDAGTCQCIVGYQASNDDQICFAQLLFMECRSNSQCTGLLGTASYCDASQIVGRCTCDSMTSIPAIDFSKCLILANAVGESCEENSQCSRLENTECSMGKCSCIPKTIPSSQNDKCLGEQTYGGECEENVQCVTNHTSCRYEDGKYQCTCINDFTVVDEGPLEGKQCYQIRHEIGQGNSCKHTEQCHEGLGPASECKISSDPDMQNCVCAYNAAYLPSTTKCHFIFRLGQECTEDGQCIVLLSKNQTCSV